MTTLAMFSQEPWAHALGWTLLHFVWQGALVALLLCCGLTLLDGQAARVRYGVCCGALALMVALPVATFVKLGGLDGVAVRGAFAQPWMLSVEAVSGGAGLEWMARTAEILNVAAIVLPWIWLAGVAVCGARLAAGMTEARRLRVSGRMAPEEGLERLFAAVAERVGVRRMVRLVGSVRVEVPTVVGWLKPAVLLPVGCFAGLSTVQMEALLAHELAHIRRHDYLVSVLQAVVEALLFYHPAVWWVSRQVRRERECCCDDIAAAVAGDSLELVSPLIPIIVPPSLAMKPTMNARGVSSRCSGAVSYPASGRASALLQLLDNTLLLGERNNAVQNPRSVRQKRWIHRQLAESGVLARPKLCAKDLCFTRPSQITIKRGGCQPSGVSISQNYGIHGQHMRKQVIFRLIAVLEDQCCVEIVGSGTDLAVLEHSMELFSS